MSLSGRVADMLAVLLSITQEIGNNGGLLVGGHGVCVWSEAIVPILQGRINRASSFVTKMSGTQARQNRRFLVSGADDDNRDRRSSAPAPALCRSV